MTSHPSHFPLDPPLYCYATAAGYVEPMRSYASSFPCRHTTPVASVRSILRTLVVRPDIFVRGCGACPVFRGTAAAAAAAAALTRGSYELSAALHSPSLVVCAPRTDSTDSPDCVPILLSISVFCVLVFSFHFFSLVPCGRFS